MRAASLQYATLIILQYNCCHLTDRHSIRFFRGESFHARSHPHNFKRAHRPLKRTHINQSHTSGSRLRLHTSLVIPLTHNSPLIPLLIPLSAPPSYLPSHSPSHVSPHHSPLSKSLNHTSRVRIHQRHQRACDARRVRRQQLGRQHAAHIVEHTDLAEQQAVRGATLGGGGRRDWYAVRVMRNSGNSKMCKTGST